MFNFADLLRFEPFESEWKTQYTIHKNLNICKGKRRGWCDKVPTIGENNRSVTTSDNYREEGNRLFRANKELNALKASDCYTKAILAAPPGSKSLSLAYANRAAALSEFGYFKEAYEDCQCAIEYGYPKENIDKVISRQANCALKLEDCDKLLVCLKKLRGMKLSSPFAKQKQVFEEELLELKKKKEKSCGKTQNVLTSPLKGRYLTATRDIEMGEEILIEEAFSFFPNAGSKICSCCAAQNIIPFPCNQCSRVFYCSLKCKKDHDKVHRIVCFAFRGGFYQETVGREEMAMHTIVTGLPTILPKLRDLKTGKDVWDKIELLAKSGEKGYPSVLAIQSNLKSLDQKVFSATSCNAIGLALYLMEFSSFFEVFEGSKCSTFDWGVIVSALLLRHIGQGWINGQPNYSIVCIDTSSEFQALADIWVKPQHLKKGELHKFSKVATTHLGIYPYLTKATQVVPPELWTKFDGPRVTATALNRIDRGAKIYEHHLDVCRNRIAAILSGNDSEEMIRIAQSVEFPNASSFHLYCCQNSKCDSTFSPSFEDICWWSREKKTLRFLTCPHCSAKLDLSFFYDVQNLSSNEKNLPKVMNIIKASKASLVGFNKVLQNMIMTAVGMFFKALKGGSTFETKKVKKIGDELNFCLIIDELEHEEVESTVYAAKSAYALDLMLKTTYQNFDIDNIRKSFNALPKEMKIVFENYLNDYF